MFTVLTLNDLQQTHSCVIYGARAAHIQPLQNVLNAAARLILHKRKYDHITSDIRDRLHWLPIQQRLEYKTCLLIFKCLHQMEPVYLTVMSDPVSASASRSHLRSAARGDLTPFDRPHISSYSSSIVTMAISCTIFEIKRDIGRKSLFFIPPLYLTFTIP